MSELTRQILLAIVIGIPVLPMGYIVGFTIARPPVANAPVSFRTVSYFLLSFILVTILLCGYGFSAILTLGGTVAVALVSTWAYVVTFVVSAASGLIYEDYLLRKAKDPNARLTSA